MQRSISKQEHREKYLHNRQWADRFNAVLADIVKHNSMHLVSIDIAPAQEDMGKATDLIIVVKGGSIATRIRSWKSMQRKNGTHIQRQWTIRAVNNGYQTELSKIREGYCDFYLYAWLEENEMDIAEWWLFDLGIWRANPSPYWYYPIDRLASMKRVIFNEGDGTGFLYVNKIELVNSGALLSSWSSDEKDGLIQATLF